MGLQPGFRCAGSAAALGQRSRGPAAEPRGAPLPPSPGSQGSAWRKAFGLRGDNSTGLPAKDSGRNK